jgi:Ca2+-transporting ATPase
VIASGVFFLELARDGDGIERAFLGAVALAVAAVPEGLATVVTVALALGVRRMAAAGAIVRRLPAVETLGSTTVILTDKTGTLTQNRMEVTSAALHGGVGSIDELSEPIREAAREVAALCNDAELDPPSGDPLDVALLEAVGAERATDLRRRSPRLAEVPFDSARKRMTVVVERDGTPALLVKGAPEIVLRASSSIVDADGVTRPLDDERRDGLIRAADAMAGDGMRTIALARRAPVDAAAVEDPDAAVGDLTAIAVLGMRDPLRPEASATVEQARGAGVRVVMVTGDHPGTASAIARDVGLAPSGHRTMTGAELRRDGVPDDPLSVGVYARVDPDQKLDLVEALQGRGDIVAVTGDGVNDAPALRRADIGVAMGMGGSDVARDASDMIVTDDNLATVVRAIREGRAIYDNVRKVVDYLIAGNLSEITVVVGSLLLFVDLGVPLAPLQLLWINLLTDGLPAIALGIDDPAPDLMRRAPRAPGERLLSRRRLGRLAIRGVLLASGAIGALAIARYGLDRPWDEARTVLFTTLVVAHLLYAYVARLPSRGLLTNGWLLAATLAGLGLQVLLVAWPAAGRVFSTTPMPAELWILVAVAALVPVVLLGVIVRARLA